MYTHDASTFTALMMEAVHTSETSVYLNKATRCYIPESRSLHIRCYENLESQIPTTFLPPFFPHFIKLNAEKTVKV
jgi:hypothetical protein